MAFFNNRPDYPPRFHPVAPGRPRRRRWPPWLHLARGLAFGALLVLALVLWIVKSQVR